MSHDVFISYSTKDKLIADAVCAKLEESKIRAWIAPRDVPAGANFAESIINAIDTCQVFVLIWSANTNTSEHILTELNQAFGQGITIIPFRIQDVQPTSAMRYYIGRTHWLDALTPPLENHINTLINTILVNLKREGPGTGVRTENNSPTYSEYSRSGAPASFEKVVIKPDEMAKPPLQKPATSTVSQQVGVNEVSGKFQRKRKLASNKKMIVILAAGGLILLMLSIYILPGIFRNFLPALPSKSNTTPGLTSFPTETSTSVPVATASPTIAPSPTVTLPPYPTPIYIKARMDYQYPFPDSIKQKRYLYVTTMKSWHEGFDYCKYLGGYLVSIESKEENQFIYDLTRGATWLGATDEELEGTWVWANGDLMDFKSWYSDEPINREGIEHFIIFTGYSYKKTGPTWNDVPDGKHFFVCEWDA